MLRIKREILTIKNAFLYMILMLLFFSSCSTEKKLAKQFINQSHQISLMVLMPPNVFVVNEKNPDNQNSFLFSDAINDTSLLVNTLILRSLNDDSILLPFQESFQKELKSYGFKVFEERAIDTFQLIETNAFMVNLAQMELQEYNTVVQDMIEVGDNVYTKDIWLNGLNIGAWFEINQVNASQKIQSPVLFATNDLTDRYNGYFVQRFLTGEIEYRLTVDTITNPNAIDFFHFLGRLYAAYTFDYLMNNYIISNTTEIERSNRFYRYDPYRDYIFVTEEDKFIELDN